MKLLLYACAKVSGAISFMSAPANQNQQIVHIYVSSRRTCKCLVIAGNDNGPHFLIFVVLCEGVVKLDKERTGESIESFGPVQCDWKGQ